MKDIVRFSDAKCLIYFVILMFNCVLAQGQQKTEDTITVQLNSSTTPYNSEVYGGFWNISGSSTLTVNIENVNNNNISFIIFQVHSYVYNLTLSNCSTAYGSYVNGTNVGLYSPVKPAISDFCIVNSNNANVQLYISIHGYTRLDPIPGGCNMEFAVPVSPYMMLENHRDYILVEGAPAKAFKDNDCNSNLAYEFYRIYLPERDFSAVTYFTNLKNMLTLDKIAEHGDLIPITGPLWNLRRMFSAYPGTGSVYVVVAYTKTGYSVYVPTHTYACAPVDGDDGCVLLDDSSSQFTIAVMIFAGFFLCYFGHRFFKTEMFLVGMISGGIITYFIISAVSDLDRQGLVGASLLSGIFFGAIWLMFWWFYGIPLFAVMLATTNLGFLVACIVYNRMPAGIELLDASYNFWTLFVFIIILTSTALVTLTLMANILSCTVLGAFMIVYPIDFYIGSSLKYLVINTARRAVVPKFSKAILTPPFQWNDSILTMAWVALSLTGYLFQHYHSRGKPPFPPPPRSVGTRVPLADLVARTYGTLASSTSGLVSRIGNRTSTPNEAVWGTERTPLLA